jgi:molybdenum cofactor guanylyltransferase
MNPDLRISAFVLAGGRSSRMGTDKALLVFEGKTLLERTMECARSFTVDVGIVGSAARFGSYGRVVEDIFKDCGPLGGIHAALRSSRTDLNLMLAVDLPGLTAEFLRFLVSVAAKEHLAQAVVPEYEGRSQPLCAVYRREFADAAEDALKLGHFRIDSLFATVPTRKITQVEIEAAGFGAGIFRNVNTMAEFEAASSGRESK